MAVIGVPYIGDIEGNCIPYANARKEWQAMAKKYRQQWHTKCPAPQFYKMVRKLCCKLAKMGNCSIRIQRTVGNGLYIWYMDSHVNDDDLFLYYRFLNRTTGALLKVWEGRLRIRYPRACPGGFCDV